MRDRMNNGRVSYNVWSKKYKFDQLLLCSANNKHRIIGISKHNSVRGYIAFITHDGARFIETRHRLASLFAGFSSMPDYILFVREFNTVHGT